ncbi:hypothetical protein TRIUR3_05645 [Triticum urartu]|uniref:Rx N-terminal domain-containing protein n=1 Tax=Triticum urartu TaxID=4572 RepID=M7ZQZ3_TRIUA|nr:hypothetical protein TRIUR3_05645 [Triticum urartu]
MEVVMSAVAGELVSRFISFPLNKYHSSRSHSEEKVMERLQHLLMRVCTIVEEADMPYITNSGMMMQLKTLSEAMYQGYHALDNLRYRALQVTVGFEEVSINDSSGSSLYLAKRSRSTNDKVTRLESHGALESLEIAIVNMSEFIVLLGGYNWNRFYLFAIGMGRGSKIIILSRLKTLARFGSVKPIFLSAMSSDELKYLFKTLAFGSVDPTEHPRLVKLADEFGKLLHNVPDTLIAINILADVLRMNLSVQYWLCILDKGLRYIKRNLSTYGVQPSMLLEEDHPVDITDFALHPLSMIPCTTNFSIKKELPSLTLGELIRDPSVTPKQDFIIIAWESRIPPHKSFPHFVTSHAQGGHEVSALPGRKRR